MAENKLQAAVPGAFTTDACGEEQTTTLYGEECMTSMMPTNNAVRATTLIVGEEGTTTVQGEETSTFILGEESSTDNFGEEDPTATKTVQGNTTTLQCGPFGAY